MSDNSLLSRERGIWSESASNMLSEGNAIKTTFAGKSIVITPKDARRGSIYFENSGLNQAFSSPDMLVTLLIGTARSHLSDDEECEGLNDKKSCIDMKIFDCIEELLYDYL